MRRLMLFVWAIISLLSCKSGSTFVEKIRENGIEVVVNHIEPYHFKNEPATFDLSREWELDTESRFLSEIGLSAIGDFEIDAKGNVYVVGEKSEKEFVFKFDASGSFLRSYCRKGQGPGETSAAPTISINRSDHLIAHDVNKMIVFDAEGGIVNEIKTQFAFWSGEYLDNGYFLIKSESTPSDKDPGIMVRSLRLYDSRFNLIKELDSIEHENIMLKRTKGTYHNLAYEVNAGKIFVGNQERGYELLCFEMDGDIIRKIRKDYRKVKTSQRYVDEFMSLFDSNEEIFNMVKQRIYF